MLGHHTQSRPLIGNGHIIILRCIKKSLQWNVWIQSTGICILSFPRSESFNLHAYFEAQCKQKSGDAPWWSLELVETFSMKWGAFSLKCAVLKPKSFMETYLFWQSFWWESFWGTRWTLKSVPRRKWDTNKKKKDLFNLKKKVLTKFHFAKMVKRLCFHSSTEPKVIFQPQILSQHRIVILWPAPGTTFSMWNCNIFPFLSIFLIIH